jgi:hypothetical protein
MAAFQSNRSSRNRMPRWAAIAVAFGLAAAGVSGRARADASPCANPAPPPGAASLGIPHLIFCVQPTTADISVVDSTSAKLFSGSWYNQSAIPMTFYSMNGPVLVISKGGGVSTETRKSTAGALPLLAASAGFYVEFAVRLSDNDSDHWPAVWLMPQEHDAHHTDHLAGDPQGSERWMELDVDEGGFNAGHHGAVINWSGKYPEYQHQNLSNDVPKPALDRTQEHIFGMTYNPSAQKVTWWIDGASVGSVSTATLPAFVNDHHYYLIMGAQNHGANHPYDMYVRYFSAWSGPVVPNPPAGVTAQPHG